MRRKQTHGDPIFLLHFLQRPIHGCQLSQV